jgi:UDP-glucose 4-epimerase
MVRVLPLFIHRLRRSEPITVYGEHKTLDFTYVGDCVDGIVRGVEAPAAGSVVNETINLAYGRGTALVGEVTHYVADISKARALLGYEPRVPIEAGIPQAVEWFLERRASHPEEEGLPLADSDSTELAARTYVSDPRA